MPKAGEPVRDSRKLVALIAFGVGAVTLWPTPAAASCAAPEPFPKAFDSAPAVFTGTVVDLENGRRWATVRVDEVWKGDDLPEQVEVRAGPRDPAGPIGAATSVDRHFRRGTRYLFVPYQRSGAVFRDNNCTRTTAFRPALERLRPPGAEEIEPSSDPTLTPSQPPFLGGRDEDGASSTPWLALTVVGLAGVSAVVFLSRRFR